MFSELEKAFALYDTILRIWQSKKAIIVLEGVWLSFSIQQFVSNIDLGKDTISLIFYNISFYRNMTVIYFVIAALLFLLWSLSRRLPKVKKNEIGIVIAITPENETDANIVKRDFVDSIKKEISRIENGRFRFIDLSSYHTRKLLEKRSLIDKYHELTRAKLIIWGTSSVRKHNGEPCYVLSLFTSIYHGKLLTQQHIIIQEELINVFPVENLIPLKNEYLGFKISSACFALSSRYIIGIAAFFSGNLDLALKIHSSILAQDNPDEDNKDINIITRVRNNSKLFVLDEASAIAGRLYNAGRLDEMDYYIRLIDTLDCDSYQSLLLKSIYHFLKSRDTKKALEMISKASKNKREYTWAYNKAFLEAYNGNIDNAYKTYEIAFQNFTSGDVHLQVEAFIKKILAEEPNKYQLHYCLGLICMKKKEDYKEAIEYFEEFNRLNEIMHKFDSSIKYSEKMIEKCKKEIARC